MRIIVSNLKCSIASYIIISTCIQWLIIESVSTGLSKFFQSILQSNVLKNGFFLSTTTFYAYDCVTSEVYLKHFILEYAT